MIRSTLSIVLLITISFVALTGCEKKKTGTQTNTNATTEQSEHDGHDHGSHEGHNH